MTTIKINVVANCRTDIVLCLFRNSIDLYSLIGDKVDKSVWDDSNLDIYLDFLNE